MNCWSSSVVPLAKLNYSSGDSWQPSISTSSSALYGRECCWENRPQALISGKATEFALRTYRIFVYWLFFQSLFWIMISSANYLEYGQYFMASCSLWFFRSTTLWILPNYPWSRKRPIKNWSLRISPSSLSESLEIWGYYCGVDIWIFILSY